MTLYTAAVTLILVMDPLGNVPVFLAVLRRYEARMQTKIIIRETLIALLVLLIFLFFGQYIMHGLQLTASALSIAGGVILFLIAIRMIFPNQTIEIQDDDEPFIVPLAIPLTAGPSALAMVLLFAAKQPEMIWTWALSILIASIVFLVIVLCGNYLMRLLGKRGLIAIERLMGMILTTVAVQMFLTGVGEYLHVG
ncbi:MAG: hypothetical protein CL816_00185 [Coxiellaceae bacterium]|nr:hypothetical protein [Coxiellaceae bacterium]|tara:strand:- start:3783 stop:4367 length:585 start_codon:yes stop_codon:yes gene_type:complete